MLGMSAAGCIYEIYEVMGVFVRCMRRRVYV